MTELDVRLLVRWLADQDGQAHLAVACAEHADVASWQQAPVTELDDGPVYVFDRCLAAVPVAVLLEVAAPARDVTALLDGCDDRVGATSVVAEARRLLSAAGHADALRALMAPPSPPRRTFRTRRRRPVLTATTVPVARRRLFGLAADDPLDPPSPNPRRRTVEALRRLRPDAAATQSLQAVGSGAPRLKASGCAGEAVCVRACPEQALALATAARSSAREQFVLSVDPAVCTACGVCVDVCPEGALRLDGEYGWGDLLPNDTLPLAAGSLQRCTRCRAPHAGTGSLCELCAARRANPFASRLPPGRRGAAAGRG